MSSHAIRAILDAEAAKPRFDGFVHGWRLAPDQRLREGGVRERDLKLQCEPKPAGAETPTQLDFIPSYLPYVETARTSLPTKWVCGGTGLSVMHETSLATPYGAGDVWIERAVWGNRTLAIDAAEDRVQTGRINGHPAILVHPAHDESGLGIGQVIVIEDDSPPSLTILRVVGDNGIPFAELIRVAEGVR